MLFPLKMLAQAVYVWIDLASSSAQDRSEIVNYVTFACLCTLTSWVAFVNKFGIVTKMSIKLIVTEFQEVLLLYKHPDSQCIVLQFVATPPIWQLQRPKGSEHYQTGLYSARQKHLMIRRRENVALSTMLCSPSL